MNSSPFSPFGLDLFGEPLRPAVGVLSRRFTVQPFSVLDARSGEWQDRKAAWLSCGIQSEIGRKPTSQSSIQAITYKNGGRVPEADDRLLQGSVFDPVLCEIAYRWFCVPGGQVIDPFAGGSVRGVVAALLGYRYWGCDLRPEQVAANEAQAREICDDDARPTWVFGDALELLDDAPTADLIFTCPPYGDLERYSSDPRDLSTMDYPDFLSALRRAIELSARKLKAGGMAVIVVGDFRDRRTGYYRGFVADTVTAFRGAGLALYNDAVLLTMVGSIPIRVGRQFESSRKLGKTHQNVLVFLKPTR